MDNKVKCLKKEDMNLIAHLFDGWDETIIWSCLQGYMGNAYISVNNAFKSAQVITADFCFYAGEPDKELVKNIPEEYKAEYILMIPQNREWGELIEQVYKENGEKLKRYAIKKEGDNFDREKLQGYIDALPSEYGISMVNEELYNTLISNEWSKDLCSAFKEYKSYEEYGIGAVVLHNGIPVSGASSYTVYNNGIEIEIDTEEKYRRKGLALACASKLILECLEKGLYPSWDAHDLRSVALAEKLGYHMDKEYDAYCINTGKGL